MWFAVAAFLWGRSVAAGGDPCLVTIGSTGEVYDFASLRTPRLGTSDASVAARNSTMSFSMCPQMSVCGLPLQVKALASQHGDFGCEVAAYWDGIVEWTQSASKSALTMRAYGSYCDALGGPREVSITLMCADEEVSSFTFSELSVCRYAFRIDTASACAAGPPAAPNASRWVGSMSFYIFVGMAVASGIAALAGFVIVGIAWRCNASRARQRDAAEHRMEAMRVGWDDFSDVLENRVSTLSDGDVSDARTSFSYK